MASPSPSASISGSPSASPSPSASISGSPSASPSASASLVDVLAVSAEVPPGWYYDVIDAGNSLQIRVGKSDPPDIVVEEVQLTGTDSIAKLRWVETKLFL